MNIHKPIVPFLADPKVPSLSSMIINMLYSVNAAIDLLESECPADLCSIDDLVGFYISGWEVGKGDDTTVDTYSWKEIQDMHIDPPKCYHNLEVRRVGRVEGGVGG